MSYAPISWVFLLGLLIGSFLNVVAIRLLKQESIVYPPSQCAKCKHRLRVRDLVPLFSWLYLSGKCRYCRAKISPRYPLGELATGLLFALSYAIIGFDKELLAALLLVSIFVIITQTDIEQMIIPNSVVLAGIILAIPIRIWSHPLPWWNYAIAFFIGSGTLLLLGVIWEKLLKKEAMGGGDIKLYAFIGAVIGLENTLLSLLLASVAGLLFGVVHLIRKGRQSGKQLVIPFGPFIAIGSLAAFFWGESLLEWYIGLI